MQAIEAKVIQLFAFVTEDLAVATQALLTGDGGALKLLGERETVVDLLYLETEELINTLMALQAPVAADLRLLLSVLRIVPELERSHDLIIHIAEHAARTRRDGWSPRCRALLKSMGETADGMWNQVSRAWYQRDKTAADVLDESDDDLDALHAALLTELASGRMTLPMALEMTLVARFYERLGDHAVNVARRVVYLAGLPPRV